MKFFNCSLDFNYSWKDVALALFQRYPNPFSKHVLTEDVLDRYVTEEGKLYTIKLLTKTNPLPRWGERFYSGPKFVAILEESIVDPEAESFTTYTRNISMAHFMSCTEKCVYSAAKEPGQTLIEKSAWLNSAMGYGLRVPILEFSVQRYKSNQQKATAGLDYTISHRLPPTLRERVRQKKEHLAETAIHSKDYLSQKAKQASEIAKAKAEQATIKAKSKADRTKVQASEV